MEIDAVKKLKKLRQTQIDLNLFGKQILDGMYMTFGEYKKIEPEQFIPALKDLFIESSLVSGGTDFFNWSTDDVIQERFEDFVKNQINSSFKYLFCKGKTFHLQKVQKIWTVRSVVENTTFKFDDKGQLVYHYSGSTYNGFGRLQHQVTQTVTIDVDKQKIVDFTDSKSRRSHGGIRFINLDTKFIS